MLEVMGNLQLGGLATRDSQFVPQLYHIGLSLGFHHERIMPSRAFCSDDGQGYPVLCMAQNCGTFPFDRGQIGGKVTKDRHRSPIREMASAEAMELSGRFPRACPSPSP